MDTVEYSNRTLHGGINSRTSRRLIAEEEATNLVNVDISIPGKRSKRLEPAVVFEDNVAVELVEP